MAYDKCYISNVTFRLENRFLKALSRVVSKSKTLTPAKHVQINGVLTMKLDCLLHQKKNNDNNNK